jgi:hypothetical protein
VGGQAGGRVVSSHGKSSVSAGPARHSQHSEHTLQLQSRVQTTGCAAADQAAVNKGRGRPTHPGTHPPTLISAAPSSMQARVGSGATWVKVRWRMRRLSRTLVTLSTYPRSNRGASAAQHSKVGGRGGHVSLLVWTS